MWIGDFVRCHTVVRLLNQRFPNRPIDILTTANIAPLVDYMPGVRQGIVWDLPRRELALSEQWGLGGRLRQEGYGQVLVMSRAWKSVLAPTLAGIPVRTGFVGEARFGLINDMRWGERKLPRMIDRCAALAMPKGQSAPDPLPLPMLAVPQAEIADWRARNRLTDPSRPVAVLAPGGASGEAKRWPAGSYASLARRLAGEGLSVWVVGGPGEREVAQEIAKAGPHITDLTGTDLRNAIIALAAGNIAVSNDSGLLHVAAALGTPAIGIFGPTSPWHWAPLNPIAAVIQAQSDLPCRPCHKPVCRLGHHRCMVDVSVETVAAAATRALQAR